MNRVVVGCRPAVLARPRTDYVKTRNAIVSIVVSLAALGLGVGAIRARATVLQSCRLSQLTIAFGPEISPATGQNPRSLRLTNRGRSPCSLDGYPTIGLSDRAGPVPFVISHGGDQMVTAKRPARVVVRPGRSAFVVLNHYRCDLGTVRTAGTLRLGLPGARRSPSTLIANRVRIGYCGKGDPGSVLSVSPFEPSLRAAIGH
jgi:hypothetical protein